MTAVLFGGGGAGASSKGPPAIISVLTHSFCFRLTTLLPHSSRKIARPRRRQVPQAPWRSPRHTQDRHVRRRPLVHLVQRHRPGPNQMRPPRTSQLHLCPACSPLPPVAQLPLWWTCSRSTDSGSRRCTRSCSRYVDLSLVCTHELTSSSAPSLYSAPCLYRRGSSVDSDAGASPPNGGPSRTAHDLLFGKFVESAYQTIVLTTAHRPSSPFGQCFTLSSSSSSCIQRSPSPRRPCHSVQPSSSCPSRSLIVVSSRSSSSFGSSAPQHGFFIVFYFCFASCTSWPRANANYAT